MYYVCVFGFKQVMTHADCRGFNALKCLPCHYTADCAYERAIFTSAYHFTFAAINETCVKKQQILFKSDLTERERGRRYPSKKLDKDKKTKNGQ